MDTLTVELTAALVDNPATPTARTEVEITLDNPTGHFLVENCEGSPRSVHRFIIKDASDMGCGGIYNLTAEQAASVLAISCSLTNPRVLFSPLQPNQLPVSLKLDKVPSVPSKVEVVDTPSGKDINIIVSSTIHLTSSVSVVLGTKLILIETQVLSVASKLLAFKVFDATNRSLLELNVIESIKRYREALMSTEGLSCYKSLYNALEKAVNADKDRKNKVLDAAASALTGLSDTDIENLRLFNNRVKHSLRNKEDFDRLKAGEAQLAQRALNLKKAADSSILSRI